MRSPSASFIAHLLRPIELHRTGGIEVIVPVVRAAIIAGEPKELVEIGHIERQLGGSRTARPRFRPESSTIGLGRRRRARGPPRTRPPAYGGTNLPQRSRSEPSRDCSHSWG